MQQVAGIDLEASGLDFHKDFITEIGCVIFDGDTWQPIAEFETFVHIPEALPLSPEIVKLTGITDDMVRSGLPFEEAIARLVEFTKDCDLFVAHNKSFDSQMLAANIQRLAATVPIEFVQRQWICSKGDVETHINARCTKLSHLSLDYGLLVDGSKLHRAINDVRLMGQMLAKTGKTAREIKAWSDEPITYFEALTQGPWKDGGKSTAEAKALGYGWQTSPGTYAPVFPKKWVKAVRQSRLEAEKNNVPQTFKRVTIKPEEVKE